MQSSEIEERMNRAGQERRAFLFGIDFEMEGGFFLTDPLAQQTVLFDIKGVGNAPQLTKRVATHFLEAFPESFSTYEQRFQIVMNALKRGDTYLTNLTIRTPVSTSLSLQDIFLHTRASYRLCLPDKFVCFSPECFVLMEAGKIVTFPMKGTIDERTPHARQMILSDPKETAEHHTIVDLLRNDLSRIAKGVKINRFRYIDKLMTNKGPLLQVSSEIEGELPADYLQQLGTLFFELLPAGSVSGAPKPATLALIRRAEKISRGYYTGIGGYFDGNRLDTFVLIRYIEKDESGFYFRSGGGITAQSNCRKEYEEALQKIYLPF